MGIRIPLFLALILVMTSTAKLSAGMIMSITLDLRYDPQATGTGETFYSPTLLYMDEVNFVPFFEINLGNPDLPWSPFPYQNTFFTPGISAPPPGSSPYAGFLSYYSYTAGDVVNEGMIVGFRPDYTPVDDFDTIFTAVSGITEADSLAVMKNANRPPFDVFHRIFQPMTASGLMPRWESDPVTGDYSMSMNIYAFSSPTLAGTGSGSITFTATPVPEPSSVILMSTAGMLIVPWARKRKRKKIA